MKKKINSIEKNETAELKKKSGGRQKISVFVCVGLWLILLCFSAAAQTKPPQNVREFFMLLPNDYYFVQRCDTEKDKTCRRAKLNYLRRYAKRINVKNGYLNGGGEDGEEGVLTMRLFQRPDKTFLVGLDILEDGISNFHYFLDYKDGVWTDVSAETAPEFSKKNIYLMPRVGGIVKVYAKKIIEAADSYEISERGAKLYDLEWKDGKFTKVKIAGRIVGKQK